MLISLEELKHHRVRIAKTYDAGTFDYGTDDFRQVGPLDVQVTAELVGAEIRVRGHLSTRVEAACDRCLRPVELPVATDFDLFYRPMRTIARNEEVEISPDELEIGFYSGDGIDLADVVTEQVNLFMPMKVICRAECRGLCPVCGADWNVASCQCRVGANESPFAWLLGE